MEFRRFSLSTNCPAIFDGIIYLGIIMEIINFMRWMRNPGELWEYAVGSYITSSRPFLMDMSFW